MIDRDKERTKEHKDSNEVEVTVKGKKKFLLMDDEDVEGDTELQEMIEALVAEALMGLAL